MFKIFKKIFGKKEVNLNENVGRVENFINTDSLSVCKERYDNIRIELGCPRCGRGFAQEGTERYEKWFSNLSQEDKDKLISAKNAYEDALATKNNKKQQASPDRSRKKSEVLRMLGLWFKKLDELSSKIQANSIYDTLHYCICNSRQISLGKRSEAAIDDIVSSHLGFEVLNTEVWYAKKGENAPHKRRADHVWRVKKGVIYVIEQKLKDNHDNTKKDGQEGDFNAKVKTKRNEYPNERVQGIFWFVDDSEKPSERTLGEKLLDDCSVRYGSDIFSGIEGGDAAFSAILNWFDENRHKDLNINFDKDPEFYFNDILLSIDEKKKGFLMKFMGNEKVRKYILPVISPEGKFTNMVEHYFGMKK